MIDDWVSFVLLCLPEHLVSFVDGKNAQVKGINTPARVLSNYWQIKVFVCDFLCKCDFYIF